LESPQDIRVHMRGRTKKSTQNLSSTTGEGGLLRSDICINCMVGEGGRVGGRVKQEQEENVRGKKWKCPMEAAGTRFMEKMGVQKKN